jgi:hypothetical protein
MYTGLGKCRIAERRKAVLPMDIWFAYESAFLDNAITYSFSSSNAGKPPTIP